MTAFQGKCLIPGIASANLLYTNQELSFWGGVNLESGEVVDHHHALCGRALANHILAIPSGKGSCSGSSALLELLHGGVAPQALIFERIDPILILGVQIAKKIFNNSIPVVVLSANDFQQLHHWQYAAIAGAQVRASNEPLELGIITLPEPPEPPHLELSSSDREILSGTWGVAAKIAMEVVIEFARMQGAASLLTVSRAHIDACIYTGPAGLLFAEKLSSMGAKFVVPTTLNSISIDQRRWEELGMEANMSRQASALANAYLLMGAQSTFSCAPYSVHPAPNTGEQIGWSESNAVIFANSILGARTQKYPDFLDVCIALTGRAPRSGCHTSEGRLPSLRIHVREADLPEVDDATFAALGYTVGRLAQHRIPLVTGLEFLKPTMADLKAFSAAFGTTSSAPMFHITGITPEASGISSLPIKLPCIDLQRREIMDSLSALNTAQDPSVHLISLGNPHFLIEEFERLAAMCSGRRKSSNLNLVITTNRLVYQACESRGFIDALHHFGATVITDTCWCMLGEPVISADVRNIMTNSAKYAHYAPGMVRRRVHFGSLAACVEAACTGSVPLEGASTFSQP